MGVDEVNGSKATIREVRDLFDKLKDETLMPMSNSLARIEIQLKQTCDRQQIDYDAHEKFKETHSLEHTAIWKSLNGKISIKAFSAWLAGASIFIGIVLTLLKFFRVM